jgi:hypothetical protein
MKWSDAGGSFEQPEPGTYAAVCYKILDIGTQEGEYQGQKTIRRQVIIGWELTEKMTTGDNAGKPFVVSKFYTQSLNDKATLRHDLAGWRGRDFTPEELAGFDAKNIIGKSCMLSITLSDKGKIKVSSVVKLPRGMEAPKQVNPSMFLSLEPNDYDHKVFDVQTEKMKAMIMASPEWQSLQRRAGKASDFEAMPDDLPWKDEEEMAF